MRSKAGILSAGCSTQRGGGARQTCDCWVKTVHSKMHPHWAADHTLRYTPAIVPLPGWLAGTLTVTLTTMSTRCGDS